jgi:DNA-binding GntR family transcriptional regulator
LPFRPLPGTQFRFFAMKAIASQPSIVDQAYRSILDAICDGRLAPGERITQETIAAKLSVSRQPVGQALLMLKQQKFLIEAGKKGLMVAPLDRDLVSWIYELRLGIDPLAAALAAQRASSYEIAFCRDILAEGGRAMRERSIEKLIAADMQFHMQVYEMSGNGLLVEMMSQFWNHLRRAMREVLQHREYRRQVWDEHAEVLAAIEAHDADAAANLSRMHLANAARHVRLDLARCGPLGD